MYDFNFYVFLPFCLLWGNPRKNKINALNVSKIKVMFATAAQCVSVNGWNLLDYFNKRLMLNNEFKRGTIEILENKRLKSSKLIMRSFNNTMFFEKEKENDQGQNE